jgi:hypothetical protein
MNRTRVRAVARRRRERLGTERLESRLPLASVGMDDAVPLAAMPDPATSTVQPRLEQSLDAVVRRALAVPGPIVHHITSPFQQTKTLVRVLVPDSYSVAKTYRTIYVLPVEPGRTSRYGDGLEVVARANLHNLHDVIFVAPTFTQMPWYGDHPTKTTLRQETHFLDVVIPFVENNYAVSRHAADRLLLGFSKSGFGAFSMLLRHPDRLGRALAWDSPLALAKPLANWGLPPLFGSTGNFQKHQVTRLITQRAAELANGPARLILAGWNWFPNHHAVVVKLLRAKDVPHVNLVSPRYQHRWNSGWVPAAVDSLLA